MKTGFCAHSYLEKFTTGTITFDDLTAYSTPKELMVPVIGEDGQAGEKKFIYLDNAATLPILSPVAHYASLLESQYRSNVGRSYGFKERLMRLASGSTRLEAMKYFKAPRGSIALLGSNVTGLFQILIKHINAAHPEGLFFLSPLSHSALAIPIHNIEQSRWQHLQLDENLNYDLEFLENLLMKSKKTNRDISIAIETVSNVTGFETNWPKVLKLAERFKVRVLLDNAQGACFVDVNLRGVDAEVFVGVSGHKMGARDGSAALVGPPGIFNRSRPLEPTAGMIFHYTEDREFYMPAPATLEPGTPNFIAQASLGESFRLLGAAGFEQIRAGIKERTGYLVAQLSSMEQIKILGSEQNDRPRFGPVSFIAYTKDGKEIPSMAIAASLAYFHGIQVRANHHCAPILIQRLKGISNADANEIASIAMESLGDEFDTDSHPLMSHLEKPADPLSVLHTVRPSISFSTTKEMIDQFIGALKTVLEKRHYKNLAFVHNKAFGFNEYVPKGFDSEVTKAVLFPDTSFKGIVLSTLD